MYFEFLKRKKLRRFTAGLLAAAVLFSPVSFPQTALAADTDGLIYGTGTDSYTEENTGSISIGANNQNTSGTTASDSAAASSSAGSTAAADNTAGLVLETLSAVLSQVTAASAGLRVSVGAGSSSLTQTSLAADTSVRTSGLLYGARSTNLFSAGKTFLTILGKADASSPASYGTDFYKMYTALEAYFYLKEEGFSPAAACGILGNILRDSKFDSQAVCEADGAYGLFQCTGSLRASLEAECEDLTDGLQQVRVMVEQLAPELFKAYSRNGGRVSYEAFKMLTYPEDAAEIWRTVLTGASGSTAEDSAHQDYARDYYDRWSHFDGSGFDIIEEAMKYLGGRYVYGGDSLVTGIDCSHYVCKILSISGHYDGDYRNSYSLRTLGTEVLRLSEAQPGDVLCWNGHVAFYIADGFFINAASTKKGICIGSDNILSLLGGLITIRRVR